MGRGKVYVPAMLIWAVFAAVLGACMLAVLMPLSRREERAVADADARALYEAQMGDIARDLDRGVITAESADLARAEAARRLLRFSRDVQPVAEVVTERALRRRRAAAAIILAAVPLVALPVYALYGSPQLPAKPLAVRMSSDPERMDMGVALAQIESHLALNPGDARGWELLAPVYMRLGRYEDAARAIASIVALSGPTMDRLVDLGEARVLAAGGVVTQDARLVFEQAKKLGELNPKGRYFLAVAREQDGDVAGAIADFRSMLASAPPGANWADFVRERLARMEGQPTLQVPVPPGGEAIAALPPEQRVAAIRGMVDGLAARLASQGGTRDEWLRLVRSQAALGDREAAVASYARARAALGSDPEALAALDDLGRQVGIGVQP
jgi:cytochrome c-type biogenesis protein CcmH